MLRHEAATAAPPQVAWQLIAEPARWHEWAPHLRGAWGLGSPQVQQGRRGAARLLGAVPVPALISDASRDASGGGSWTWRVGPASFEHVVRATASGGATVAITCEAPWPLERVIALSYWPLVGLLVERLARAAERAS